MGIVEPFYHFIEFLEATLKVFSSRNAMCSKHQIMWAFSTQQLNEMQGLSDITLVDAVASPERSQSLWRIFGLVVAKLWESP